MRYTVIALYTPWSSDQFLNVTVIAAEDPIDAVRKRIALVGVNTQPSEPCQFVVVASGLPAATLVNYEPPSPTRITYGSLD
jgi:hypothetical protein